MSLLFIILINFLPLNIENIQTSPLDSFEENIQLTTTVLYIFIGSDWCADCRRLEKNVLNDSVFITSMRHNEIKVEIIDFPQRKKLAPEIIKYNESIAETYDFQGIFPTLVLSQAKKKYEILLYKNEKASEFSEIVLDKLKYLNE